MKKLCSRKEERNVRAIQLPEDFVEERNTG